MRAWWSGATTSDCAELLAEPIEAELAKIEGVSRLITRCDKTGCSILLQHDSTVDSRRIAFQADAAIKRLETNLPEGAGAAVYPSDLHRRPDLVVALVLNAPKVKTEHYGAARQFARRLMQLPSVVRYEVPGSPEQEIRVDVDPALAGKYGVSVSEITEALRNNIVLIAECTRGIVGQNPAEEGDVGDIVLKKLGRAKVKIKDVARIRSVSVPAAVYHVDGEPAILIKVFLRSGASAAEARACLDRVLKQKRPAPVKRVVPISLVSDW